MANNEESVLPANPTCNDEKAISVVFRKGPRWYGMGEAVVMPRLQRPEEHSIHAVCSRKLPPEHEDEGQEEPASVARLQTFLPRQTLGSLHYG